VARDAGRLDQVFKDEGDFDRFTAKVLAQMNTDVLEAQLLKRRDRHKANNASPRPAAPWRQRRSEQDRRLKRPVVGNNGSPAQRSPQQTCRRRGSSCS